MAVFQVVFYFLGGVRAENQSFFGRQIYEKIGLEANFSFNEVCPPYIKEFGKKNFFQFRGPFYTSMLNFLNSGDIEKS